METMDKTKIKKALAQKFVNIAKACKAYGIPYKTFIGWISGHQASLKTEETLTKVKAMLTALEVDYDEDN